MTTQRSPHNRGECPFYVFAGDVLSSRKSIDQQGYLVLGFSDEFYHKR